MSLALAPSIQERQCKKHGVLHSASHYVRRTMPYRKPVPARLMGKTDGRAGPERIGRSTL